MPKKRSKQAKIKAQRQRQTQVKSKKTVKSIKTIEQAEQPTEKIKTDSFNHQLFSYNPKLIFADLRKTFLVSLVVLLVLAFFALRYT